MKTGYTADADGLCQRELELFKNAALAWDHMRKHVLGDVVGGSRTFEEEGWRLLIAELHSELAAGKLEELRELARSSHVESPPPRLEPLYRSYLESIVQAVERGVARGWYWEEKPGSDCRWKLFSLSGIFMALDEDYVLTGFLLYVRMGGKDDLFVPVPYDLFQACFRRLQWKYNEACKSNRVESTSDELLELFQHGIDESTWSSAH
jgi:hypothetical protein